MSRIDIKLGHDLVGFVTFTQPQTALNAVRTASGFRVQIPARMTFSPLSGNGLPLTLERLRTIFCADDCGKQSEIGTASSEAIYATPIEDSPILLSWDWTITAFAFYERLRAGGEPKFRLQMCGDIVIPCLSPRFGAGAQL